MILDHLENIERYKGIYKPLFKGLSFLKNVEQNIAPGTYKISSLITMIVSEYETQDQDKGLYECHQKMIDIQYPITGLEKVIWAERSGMEIVQNYDQTTDREYYKEPLRTAGCIIGDGNFIIFFPGEPHNPQLAAFGDEQFIKKVTIKIQS